MKKAWEHIGYMIGFRAFCKSFESDVLFALLCLVNAFYWFKV